MLTDKYFIPTVGIYYSLHCIISATNIILDPYTIIYNHIQCGGNPDKNGLESHDVASLLAEIFSYLSLLVYLNIGRPFNHAFRIKN